MFVNRSLKREATYTYPSRGVSPHEPPSRLPPTARLHKLHPPLPPAPGGWRNHPPPPSFPTVGLVRACSRPAHPHARPGLPVALGVPISVTPQQQLSLSFASPRLASHGPRARARAAPAPPALRAARLHPVAAGRARARAHLSGPQSRSPRPLRPLSGTRASRTSRSDRSRARAQRPLPLSGRSRARARAHSASPALRAAPPRSPQARALHSHG